MTLVVGGVLESDRYLPADVGLPVEGALAGPDGRDVERASRAGWEARPVQEDACIVHQARGGHRCAVVGVLARGEESLLDRLGVELHHLGIETGEGSDHVLDIVVVDEVGPVTAASLGHLGRVVVEDALAPLAIDAAMVRSHVGRVDHPGAVLGRVAERDPFVHVVDVVDGFGSRS